jgi:hypothetical protein
MRGDSTAGETCPRPPSDNRDAVFVCKADQPGYLLTGFGQYDQVGVVIDLGGVSPVCVESCAVGADNLICEFPLESVDSLHNPIPLSHLDLEFPFEDGFDPDDFEELDVDPLALSAAAAFL